MIRTIALLLALQAAFAAGAVTEPVKPAAIAVAGGAIVVAHDRTIDVFDRTGLQRLWSTSGPSAPSFAIASATRVAIVDSLNDTIEILDLDARSTVTILTAATPVAGTFDGDDLLVLERDASSLTRYDAAGRREKSVALEPDPAFMRRASGLVYVYSRGTGVVQEIDPVRLAVTRRYATEPGASDFEIDATAGYLAYPREAKLRSFHRETLAASGELAVGAVPVDIELAGGANAISARRLAIADPSSKRVWVIEGRQSVTQAFFRGFLRGLLGVGGGARNSSFPTGVDRTLSSGSRLYAYDSSSQTLYRVEGRKAKEVAMGIPAAAFAASGDGLAVWSDGRVRLVR